MALPLVFDFYNSIIEVPDPDTTLDIQYLVNQIRDTEDELSPAMPYSKIMDAYGKQPLGGGTYVGITVMLLDNWRVRFEARSGPDTVSCLVSGGNLVAESGNPIAPSAYTTVSLAQSSSPTIATSVENIDLKFLIASLAGKQKQIGDVFYWDPVNGSDANSGTSPGAAVQTFTAAQALATAGNYDVIYCLANDASGITTVTTPITINKRTLKLRGPGHIFQIAPTAAGSDTITISADDVEINGLYASTATSGTDNAVSITSDRAFIQDCWLSNVRGHGINISSSSLTQVSTCAIEHCGTSGTGNGINIGNNTTQMSLSQSIIFDNVNGILLSGTGIEDNVLENCLIYKHSTYGVTIGSGVLRTTLRSGNTFNKNTSGNTQDLGTDTYIETQAGGASVSEIADAVWDEVIAGHVTAGTAGRMLRDAKTKATLASLR